MPLSTPEPEPEPEPEIPIERLQFYSDEKLSFCLSLKIHLVRCPKNTKIPIEMIPAEECESCREGK